MLSSFLKITLSLALIMVLNIVYSVPTDAATLKFNPSTLKMKTGDKKTVTVVLDTEGKKAFGAVSTIKFSTGSDVVRINRVTASSEIGFNAMKNTDSSSAGDGRVSFTVINESFFINTVNLATLEVEALKKGSAKMSFTTADPEPSTVADFDTSNELLTTQGSLSFTVDSSSDSDEDNDEDEDDNGSNNTPTPILVNNANTIPATGTEDLSYLALFGLSLLAASFAIKKIFIS